MVAQLLFSVLPPSLRWCCSEVRLAFEKKKQSSKGSDRKSPENSRSTQSQALETTTIPQHSSTERHMDQFLKTASDTDLS